jgi:hypothetical protein
MATRRDDKKPATFKTPEGDIIQLMTWAGIADKLAYLLNPIIESMASINASLDSINTKLDEWIPDDNEGEDNDEEVGE